MPTVQYPHPLSFQMEEGTPKVTIGGVARSGSGGGAGPPLPFFTWGWVKSLTGKRWEGVFTTAGKSGGYGWIAPSG